jgi:hypothetical protein
VKGKKPDIHAKDMFPDAVAREFELKVSEELERERIRREARRRLRADERPATDWPVIETLRESLARPFEPIRYRIADLQPRDSRVLLAAQFKSGKSTLVVNLVKALVDGGPFLGRYDIEPFDGRVGILDFEMSPSQLRGWYRDHHIADSDRVVLMSLRGKASVFDILDPEVRAGWATRLRAAHVRYLVMDCVRPALDALGLDEHKDAGTFLVALDALLDEAGIRESLVVHHMGHTGERSRGDSRLRDWPDTEWRLVRQDENPESTRFLSAYGRDVDVPESQLAYDGTTRTLTLVGGNRKEHKEAQTSNAALDAIEEVLHDAGEPLSGRAIKAELKDSDHGRDAIDIALRYGVTTQRLQTRPGKHRATLYTPIQCPSVRQCPDSVLEHPSSVLVSDAPIGADTRTHTSDAKLGNFPQLVSERGLPLKAEVFEDTQPADAAPFDPRAAFATPAPPKKLRVKDANGREYSYRLCPSCGGRAFGKHLDGDLRCAECKYGHMVDSGEAPKTFT